MNAEQQRLEDARERHTHWKRWGPYLAERAWGTVREDYSEHGTAWEYFPHDHARSKTYRWNEDGLGGICDRHQRICFALALWNGRDPILKERLFGLTGNQGNHGEDCKESYFYLDSTPTHSYMKFLYKYPHAAYPYEELVRENQRRGRSQREYELIDTGVFHENRYCDVFVEYAKASPEDILIKITAHNRGPEPAELDLLPTVWFRNRWSWGRDEIRPSLRASASHVIELDDPYYGHRTLMCGGDPELLFTDNETNCRRLYGYDDCHEYVKDSINDYVVNGRTGAVNPRRFGTKASARYRMTIEPGDSVSIKLRLTDQHASSAMLGPDFDKIFATRIQEADEFYACIAPPDLPADARNVMRQAFAGMLWSKQYYHYVIKQWLEGDPGQPAPPERRVEGRNCDWDHLYNADVISMPDKWEYPWYAAWDLAFHCVPLALVDSEFAKEQLALMVREWYMHPNGQLPAYEWALGDVNPPVHAWAAWRVYKIEKKRRGVGDRVFLERIFHKLLLNFTWWVNRKDADGRNVFQGGFLGLDNIGVFDRSAPMPAGKHLEQADGTGWMAMYSLNLLAIALELADDDPAYEDVASKFWEHFLYIANAINHLGRNHTGMWDDIDGFFYDVLHCEDGTHLPLKLRSMVGLIPLYAVETLDPAIINKLPGFKRRMEWFIQNRQDLTANVASMSQQGLGQRLLMSVVDEKQLRRILHYMLDENEFFSSYGIRALSRAYKDHPYVLPANGTNSEVKYEPAESSTGLFGGNSNWRGPIWFPVNFLLIESLQKFHYYYGDSFRVECPTGSGTYLTLWEVSIEIERRLQSIFLRDESGHRPVHGREMQYGHDPHWRDLVLFYEYFNGDDGSGVGASHQTGWTGLVAKMLQQTSGAE